MNFFPLENPLETLPIAGRSLREWCEAGILSEAQLASIEFPWQLLDVHAELVAHVISTEGVSSTPAQLDKDAQLLVGEGTKVLPGVYVEGAIVIGKNCKIGPNCYLRGPISVGDNCHVGQAVELKNTILGTGTNVGHLSYIGDSILGNEVNLGAGTITSNLRHDGANHQTQVDGKLVDTKRRKFGTIIGNGTHTGIHTSIYPGRKLGPGTSTRPGAIVQQDLIS